MSVKEDDLHGASESRDGGADEGEQNSGKNDKHKRSHCPHIHDLAGESEVTVSSVALDFHAVTEVINDEQQT